MRFARPLLSSLLLSTFCAGGCGLSDYEDKMRRGQERLTRADELEKQLSLPARVGEDDSQPLPFFWRLPRGFDPKGKEKPFKEIFFVTFQREENAPAELSGFLEVACSVRRGEEKWEQELLQRYGLTSKTPRKVMTIAPVRGAELEFDVYDDTSRSGDKDRRVLIYLLKVPEGDFAFVFVLDKKSDNLAKLIEPSLKSLLVGPDAEKVRKAAETKPKPG